MKPNMENGAAAQQVSLQPDHWKLKLVGLYCCFTALGLLYSLTGPTLIDMEEYLGTDTSGMAGTMTAHGVGYLLGSAFCGYLYDRVQLELQIFLDTLFMGVMAAIAPWTLHVIAYGAFKVIIGAFMGLIDSTSQGYVLYLMTGHRFRNPAMQLLHGLWSLGAFLGPLIIQPFLSTRDDISLHEYYNISRLNDSDTTTVTDDTFMTSTVQMRNMTVGEECVSGKVPFSFLTNGCLAVVMSIPLFVAWLRDSRACLTSKRRQNVGETQTEMISKSRSSRVLLPSLFCWFFIYISVEDLSGNFLSSFVIKELKWPRRTGPLVASLVWGCTGVGRLLAVPVSIIASPRQMLVSSMTLTTVGYTILLTLNSVDVLVWIALGMIGMGISSCFATMVLWASQHLYVGGATSAVFLVASSTGLIVSPLLTGYLFQYFSPMWLIYLALGASVLNILIYVVCEVLIKLRKRSRHMDLVTPLSIKPVPDVTSVT